MKVHLVASASHYEAHARAVWKHLPDSLRGEARTGPQADARRLPETDVVMVAAFIDIPRALGRPTIYVEHGAAQSYTGLPNGAGNYYHGGRHPNNVVGYLGPRQDVIDRWGKPGFACGSPICDPYQLFGDPQTVAITFHWPVRRLAEVVPEVGSAFDDYIDDLGTIIQRLHDEDFKVLGHRHPRFAHLGSVWRNLGIPEVDAHEVRHRADIVIADNTSILYEMMYLGRKAVALNSPRWRRDVDHGLRFWEHAPARQVDSTEELLVMISAGFPDRFGELQTRGMATCEYVYGSALSTGFDGQRAAAWVTAFVAGI